MIKVTTVESVSYVTVKSAELKLMPYGVSVETYGSRFIAIKGDDSASTLVHMIAGLPHVSRYWLNQTINWFRSLEVKE